MGTKCRVPLQGNMGYNKKGYLHIYRGMQGHIGYRVGKHSGGPHLWACPVMETLFFCAACSTHQSFGLL